MRIYSYPYINNINNVNYQKKYVSTPSFGAKIPVRMQDKLSVLFTETKKLYLSNKPLELSDFEKIIKKISPETTVKSFSEIPSHYNISPRMGAYFGHDIGVDFATNKIISLDKAIYMNMNVPDRVARLKFFGDFIHEATHVAQEEAGDRLSTVDFCKKFLNTSAAMEVKGNSYVTATNLFKSVEYNVVQPLIQMLWKQNDLPVAIPFYNEAVLDVYYKQISGYAPSDFIKVITNSALNIARGQFPNIDDNFILRFAAKRASQEKEAYAMSLKFLKDVMGIKSAADLDYRVLLYDKMSQTFKEMAEQV